MENKYIEPQLQFNAVYHIFNCGINGCGLFHDDQDYDKFLSNYSKYIDPVVDTYAWCLLGNHFHIVIKVKKEVDILTLKSLRLLEHHTKELSDDKKPNVAKQFSHFFNSYAQYYNYKYKRHGALFERPYRRKFIDNREYFKRCLIYVHQNPIKHGFVENLTEYRYTSFNNVFADDHGFINYSTVLKFFDNQVNFYNSHTDLISLDDDLESIQQVFISTLTAVEDPVSS